MKEKVKIGFAQRKVLSNNIEQNLNDFIDDIKNLAKKGAQVICSQELFLTKYFCFEENPKHFDLAVGFDESHEIDLLKNIAAEFDVVLIVSLFEKRAKGLYHNSAIVIDSDGCDLGTYRKQHIPDDPEFYEKYYFTPGDLGYKVFSTKYGNFGVLICWDQWYPEAARLTALQGADVLFYPTAIGWETEDDVHTKKEQLDAWVTIQRSHAVANGVFVVAVNRVGVEQNTEFWGNSFVSNTMGNVIYESPNDKEDLCVFEVNLNEIENTRRTWPFFRDRRVDTYFDLNKRFLK